MKNNLYTAQHCSCKDVIHYYVHCHYLHLPCIKLCSETVWL